MKGVNSESQKDRKKINYSHDLDRENTDHFAVLTSG